MAKLTWGRAYTHEEWSRESVTNADGRLSCDWCGQRPRVLFRYNGRKGLFCNKDCYESYHGEPWHQ